MIGRKMALRSSLSLLVYLALAGGTVVAQDAPRTELGMRLVENHGEGAFLRLEEVKLRPAVDYPDGTVFGLKTPTAAYQAYVDQFPDGPFAILARNRLAMLMAGEAPVAAQQQASLPEPAEEDPGFDGQWVLMIKGEGCPMVGRAKATVTASNSSLSGTIKVGTHGTFQLHGTILPSGKIENASLQGRYHLKLRGKFEGDAARGKWRVPNGDCSGSFSLTRAGTS